MVSRWPNKLVSVGAGAGLLLLVVAQQKLWPWLTTPPPNPANTNDSADESSRPERKRAARILPYTLPDATAPRWPAAWNPHLLRHSTGWQDGVVAHGQRDPNSDNAARAASLAADLPPWPDNSSPRTIYEPWRVPLRQVMPLHPALNTSITPTGPPTV